MHGHRHHGRRFGRGVGERWYSRDQVLPRLEEYQRDLEQELADVSDLIKKLREEKPETQSV